MKLVRQRKTMKEFETEILLHEKIIFQKTLILKPYVYLAEILLMCDLHKNLEHSP